MGKGNTSELFKLLFKCNKKGCIVKCNPRNANYCFTNSQIRNELPGHQPCAVRP